MKLIYKIIPLFFISMFIISATATALIVPGPVEFVAAEFFINNPNTATAGGDIAGWIDTSLTVASSTPTGTIIYGDNDTVYMNVTLTGVFIVGLEQLYGPVDNVKMYMFVVDSALTPVCNETGLVIYSNYSVTDHDGNAHLWIKFTSLFVSDYAGDLITLAIGESGFPNANGLLSSSITVQMNGTSGNNGGGGGNGINPFLITNIKNYSPLELFIAFFFLIMGPFIILLNCGLSAKLCYIITIFDLIFLVLLGWIDIWIFVLLTIICIEAFLLGDE